MKFLDLSFSSPAENLACDEALLDMCEAGQGEEILRFWEPQTYFVVVGYANRVSIEVNVRACAEERLPILRRCSGGGTVLQGPGCLNYALILKIDEAGLLRSIGSANRLIMERNRAAVEGLLRGSNRPRQTPLQESPIANSRSPSANGQLAVGNRQSAIEVRGHTDLAIGGRKVSGNAQRRKKHFLLFHGTFLLQFDLSLIERILPLPSRQPEYRRQRAHRDFLANLALTTDSVKRVLQQTWSAFQPLEPFPHERILSLTRDKYQTGEWNLKFL